MLLLLIALNISPVVSKANKLYKKEKYEEAYELYKKASILNPDNEKIKFNMADCSYQLKRFREAGDEFARLTVSKDKDLREKSFYNLGNVFMEAKQYDQAISAYKEALLLDPKDTRAKRNLEIAKLMKEEEQKNKDKNKDQDKNQDQQQQQPQPQPQPQSQINEALKNEQKETMKEALKQRGGGQENAGKW